MNPIQNPPAAKLAIPAELKRRPAGATFLTLGWVALVIAALALWFAASRAGLTSAPGLSQEKASSPAAFDQSPSSNPNPPQQVAGQESNVVLTATGYIVPRHRIELGPKLAGTVTWIEVEKSDRVKKGQVIAKLESAEYQARFMEAQGRLALAQAEMKNAEVTHQRQVELTRTKVGSDQALDDAVRALDVARAQVLIAQGQLALAQTWLQWCEVRSPIDGVVLERLVDPDELIIPQALGGAEHPSTMLLALADPSDLQVEIDLNEADVSKIYLTQRCLIRPEAFKDKVYPGQVDQISPEADRNKGTLEVKVKIENPDRFLVPELNARVQFLGR